MPILQLWHKSPRTHLPHDFPFGQHSRVMIDMKMLTEASQVIRSADSASTILRG